MTPRLQHAWTCLALMCLHGLAVAQVPAATAEALMRKSGVWAQLADVGVQVKAGMAQSTVRTPLTSQEIKRLEQVADDAFAATRLRASFAQVLSDKISAAQGADALKWYNSPTGQLITRLEEASSADFDDLGSVLSEGNKALAHASPRRQSLLAQTVKATRAVEGMVSLQINSTLAVLQGVANTTPDVSTPSGADLRRSLEAQRPQMEASALGAMLSMFALTYQPASDRALERYLKFLSSRSGVALSVAMMEALDRCLSSAAEQLGSGLSMAPGATSL